MVRSRERHAQEPMLQVRIYDRIYTMQVICTQRCAQGPWEEKEDLVSLLVSYAEKAWNP